MADTQQFLEADQYCLFPYPKESQMYALKEDAEKTVKKYGLKAVIENSLNNLGKKCFKLKIIKEGLEK